MLLKLLSVITLSVLVTGCNPKFQAISRNLPDVNSIVPDITLCKKAKASDDVRVVALANRYCAKANQDKLVDARRNYIKLAKCYKTGECAE